MSSIRDSLKRKVLMTYLTAGDPYVNDGIMNILSRYVDIFEFGLPTTKLKYDGLTIKASHKRAVESGVTIEKAFSIIKGFQLKHKIILTYFDVAERIGLENLMGFVSEAGAEGVIFPDLLIDYIEEINSYLKLCNKYGLEPIFFITSSFPHNFVSKLARMKPAFIYLGLMASTGTLLPITAVKTIRIMRGLVGNTPLLVGFAISHPSQVKDYVKAGADGVVIGSALIKLISSGRESGELEIYIQNLKGALED